MPTQTNTKATADQPYHVTLPRQAGVSFKAEHYAHILDTTPNIGWFEVHPENYMGAGGPPHRYLTAVRERYPLSLHGVGLSIGSAGRLNQDHINRLKLLADRYNPAQVSEHLAWSTHDSAYLNDLLPLPYTTETLDIVCEHVDEVQTALARPILLENPATYVVFEESSFEEIDFLNQISSRTSCGLLLDVNNVFVSCTNHARDPIDYVSRFPMHRVGEIHLAGHASDLDDDGAPLLIDSHDRAVIDDVWQLYRNAIAQAGALPTLIEWDSDIPPWEILAAEAQKADDILNNASSQSQEKQTLNAEAHALV